MTESGIQLRATEIANLDPAAIVGFPLNALGEIIVEELAQVLIISLLICLRFGAKLMIVVLAAQISSSDALKSATIASFSSPMEREFQAVPGNRAGSPLWGIPAS